MKLQVGKIYKIEPTPRSIGTIPNWLIGTKICIRDIKTKIDRIRVTFVDEVKSNNGIVYPKDFEVSLNLNLFYSTLKLLTDVCYPDE